jgi:hypothetical protein
MHSEFCVIYDIMGFVISINGGIEQYEQKWWFWKMDWKILLQGFMMDTWSRNKWAKKNLPPG